jgi:8-oxo-dGTP pyrophosphatase MutT (NUDIX family)
MGSGVIYDLTATTLVFRRSHDGVAWLAGLVHHERLGGLLPAGGHHRHGGPGDEGPGETLAGTAIREAGEELGCQVVLLSAPTPAAPAGFPHPVCPAPWWTVDMPATADRHTPVQHRHLDHTFVGIYSADIGEPETAVEWLTEQEVRDRPDLADDSRAQLLTVFPLLGDLTRDLHPGAESPWWMPGALRPVLDDLIRERAAQDLLWGRQEFPDGTGDPQAAAEAERAKQRVADGWQAGTLSWREILTEEFWEAMAESSPSELRTELLQTAAVAIKWVQALDRRHGRIIHQVKTSGGRTERLIRDHAAKPGQKIRTAAPGERHELLVVGAYAALGRAISHADPTALVDLAEILHALAPSCGLDADELEPLRATTALDQGGYACGTVLHDGN